MANRFSLIALFLVLASIGCTPSEDAAESIVRTGNPYERGFTDADFPRVQLLADGVYSYEQLRSAGDSFFSVFTSGASSQVYSLFLTQRSNQSSSTFALKS